MGGPATEHKKGGQRGGRRAQRQQRPGHTRTCEVRANVKFQKLLVLLGSVQLDTLEVYI